MMCRLLQNVNVADIVNEMSALFELINSRSVYLHCLNDTSSAVNKSSAAEAASPAGLSLSLFSLSNNDHQHITAQLSLAIPPWVGTMSTSQRTVMHCDWE